MTAPTFRDPVAPPIHPEPWHRPAGNLELKLTQPFGCTGFPAEPPLGTCAHYHRGIDLANGHAGAPILAAAPGIVRYAGAAPSADHALRVVVDHGGGWFSGYWHLATVGVRVGARVVAGQALGTLGSTGYSTAPHLHFFIKSGATIAGGILVDGNGRWMDPWALIPHL